MISTLQVLPLQLVPGAPELLVILLIAVILFGVPLALVALGAWVWLSRREPDSERVRELEAEVERLRADIDRLRNEDEPASEEH